ncbi:FtsX-like permease family protein, partial [Gemmatimonadota bacterium]
GVAWLGTGALARFGPADFARADLTVDMRVLLFTLVLAIVVGVVFGLIPAVQISRSNTSEVLREGGHGSRSESGARRLRKGLVVTEFALALVLLAGAGLLMRTVLGLQRVDPGFVPENVLTTRVTLPASSYPDPESSRAFFGELLDRIRALPGVLAVGTTSGVPFTGQGFTSVFNVEGYTVGEGRPEPWGDIRIVHPGLEEALQIPLLKGRFIDATDDTSSRPVVVVDNEAVRRFWPDEEPLGKRITFNNPTDPNAVWFEVVGVVGHTLQNGLDDDIRLQVYFAFDQVGDTSANLVIRSAVDPVDLLPAVRASVLEIDPNQPISAPALMEDLIANSLGGRRTSMFLLLLFAGVAIVLAALGIYGVMMQVVGERTHEIGVRLTCGARGIQLVSMVMRSALMLALIGMILGLAGILALGSVIRSQLYGVAPTDPVTLVVVAFTILVVAALSTLIPAARAARTDPTITLRQE